MGRKRRREVEKTIEMEEEEAEQEIQKRKPKKIKRKKHGNIRTPPEVVETTPTSNEVVSSSTSCSSHPPLTLKIKLGGVGNEVISATSTNDHLSVGGDTSSLKSGSNLGEDWAGSDEVSLEDGSLQQEECDEEEAWLDALETGSVNKRGYLPSKVKDPAAMTARQRAMLGSKEEELLELPLIRKQNEIESEEMLLKKTERNKKRRLQAIKRREKHKADTVQRLLQKQTTKKKEEEKKVTPQVVGPHMRFISSALNGTSLSFTEGLEYPYISQELIKKCGPVQCHCCTNYRRYDDSKTKLPLCSLECYKKLNSLTATST